jgi:hypothetical protein
MSKKISYATRDFAGLRQELVNLTKQYYPDLVKNTNDASIYSVLLDLNAAVADNLHFHIDRVWQETMLDFAQQRQSLFHIAKTYGIRLPGNRPSVALCDFTINVPPRGDKEDGRYLGVIKSGAQISGGGQAFETMDEIDFPGSYIITRLLTALPGRVAVPCVRRAEHKLRADQVPLRPVLECSEFASAPVLMLIPVSLGKSKMKGPLE